MATVMMVNVVYDRVTVQGEGPFAGRRCTFVRLWGCNLHCRWCDTPETWDTKGRNGPVFERAANAVAMPVDEVVERLVALDVDLVVVTGGEPMTQRAEVFVLAGLLAAAGIATHVETNGTIAPGDLLADEVEHFVVSPKLPSADAGAWAIRRQPLEAFAALGWRRASFKFVVSDSDDIVEAAKLCDELGVERRARWVMPEGRTAGIVEMGLADIVDEALTAGFNVSTRLHVQLWGPERGR